MYTHCTFTLMAHCTSGAIRGSVSCSRTLPQGIKLATFCLLNDFSTSRTTVAPFWSHLTTSCLPILLRIIQVFIGKLQPALYMCFLEQGDLASSAVLQTITA